MGRDESHEGSGRNSSSVHRSTQAKHRVDEDEQLLPGIPDEITLDLIAPKLPWKAFYILASVSHRWQRAIQSRQVYDARVHSKLTQTLVAFEYFEHQRMTSYTIVLYSMEDGSCCHLPVIPGVPTGIPLACQRIPLNGKLYVLGGWKKGGLSSDVCVFDLAGQRQWKQCASMGHARRWFGCGVKDGRIYVFGGTSTSEFACSSEVYDPEKDAWAPITPTPSSRLSHKVTTVGEELFLHNGYSYGYDRHALSAEIYHPRKDEWRIAEHFTRNHEDKLLNLGGKLHRLNQVSIEVYDVDTNSWKYSQQNSVGVSEPSNFHTGPVYDAVGVDDTILALVSAGDEDTEEADLIKIQGVGFKNTQIIWQRLQCSASLRNYSVYSSPGMCLIQL